MVWGNQCEVSNIESSIHYIMLESDISLQRNVEQNGENNDNSSIIRMQIKGLV